ncbi:MAG: [FeFe] hydrogenase H-cluster maturation GTPase HydF [Kiritimatiellia bacterium]
MNATLEGDRVRIVFMGRRNAGKSSLLNAFAGQPVSIVSPVPGTTTDPVKKSMELLPLGPVLLVDTAGLDDDQADVGGLRSRRSRLELRSADLVLIVVDGAEGVGALERELVAQLRRAGTAFFLVLNKDDASPTAADALAALSAEVLAPVFAVSSLTGAGVAELKRAVSEIKLDEPASQRLIGDRLARGDIVVLVVPIDSAAPKGRLILPQQQTIRDIIDSGCIAVVTQVAELARTLASLTAPPRMVVTDSQVFAAVRDIVPLDVELTSFSILFARYKGDYDVLKAGVDALDALRDGDTVLVVEGCTHRRQCDDIGTVKIPKWLKAYTKKELVFEFASGVGWPEDLRRYALVVHCGGCMLPRREVRRRIHDAQDAGVPIANYGLLIAKLQGVLV